MKKFDDAAVQATFNNYPPAMRRRLQHLRELIFQTAAANKSVGEIEECLKWGEPAYVTTQSKSGSTIRLGWKVKRPDQYAMYFHCQTTLIETFRQLFADDFKFEGNRAIVFQKNDEVPKDALSFCINVALTYHLRK